MLGQAFWINNSMKRALIWLFFANKGGGGLVELCLNWEIAVLKPSGIMYLPLIEFLNYGKWKVHVVKFV